MLDLRYARRWRLGGAFLLLLALAGAVVPQLPFWDRLPTSGMQNLDKVLHVFVFFVLSVYFVGQYSRQSYWRIAVGLFAFGILIEALQALVGYRYSESGDVIADAAGIALGLVVALAGLGGWSLRVESWLDTRNA